MQNLSKVENKGVGILHTLGSARMDLNKIKEARLGGVVALDKGCWTAG